MGDIYLGLTVIFGLAVVMFLLGRKCAQSVSPRIGKFLAVGTIAAGGLSVLFLRESVALARLLPFSNLIVLANWLPLAAGFLAGLVWQLVNEAKRPRRWPVVVLAVLGAYSAIHPLLGRPPRCYDQWDEDGVCRQTSQKTCSAACAATVLSLHGIDATEQEMADLCLTRQGTTWYGLFRGLKKKTAGTRFDVEVFSGSFDDLQRLTPGRLILTAGLPRGATVDPVYEEQWGWTRGEYHTVLLFEFVENGRVEMADPDVGREQWTVEDLRVLWRGRGMRLVERRGE